MPTTDLETKRRRRHRHGLWVMWIGVTVALGSWLFCRLTGCDTETWSYVTVIMRLGAAVFFLGCIARIDYW